MNTAWPKEKLHFWPVKVQFYADVKSSRRYNLPMRLVTRGNCANYGRAAAQNPSTFMVAHLRSSATDGNNTCMNETTLTPHHLTTPGALRGSTISLPAFLSVADLASRYSVHPETIRRWIWSGLLGSIKLPGGHRVPLSAVEAFERTRLQLPCDTRLSVSRPRHRQGAGGGQASLARRAAFNSQSCVD